MQRILSLIPLCFSCLCASAQFKVTGESQVFKPEGASVQVEMLPGGNTMIINGSGTSRQIDVYDPQFKKISSKEIAPGALKNGGSFAPVIALADGGLMMLTWPEVNKVKELHRVLLDGRTGEVLKEEKLGELKKTSAMENAAKLWGNVPAPAFYGVVSKNGSHYAIIAMNSFEADRNKRIAVTIYNKDHKELARAFYVSPEDRFKYMRYLSAVVTDEGRAYIVAEGRNTRASGGKESELVLAELEAGKTEVALKMISNVPQAEAVAGATTWYLPDTKQLFMFAYRHVKGGIFTTVSYINTATGASEKNITMEKGLADSEQRFEAVYGRRPKLDAVPQNIILHADGSFATIDEALKITDDKSPTGRTYNYNSERRDIVVYQYDAAGNYLYCNIIPRNHYVPLVRVYAMSSAGGIFSTGSVGDDTEYVGEGFKSFVYLPAGTKKYVLLNDEPGNGERVANGKRPEQITRAGDTDPFVFELKKDEVFPKRSFLFNAPNARKKPVFFNIVGYDEATGRMILLRQEKGGKKKNLECKLLLLQHAV
jgi:hypothetical protein